jgi:hypothetical protein
VNNIELIPITQSDKWDRIVCSFADYDVYYLSGYTKAFQLHDDGEPLLVYYTSDNARGICVFMRKDISKLSIFNNLPFGTYFDLASPYGYGGFLFEGAINKDENFNNVYSEFLKEKGIVSEFVRYHPLLQNVENMRNFSTITDLNKTIHIDLSSEETVWNNIISKNKNVIRKAQKSGVVIKYGKDWALFQKFIALYNNTMKRDNAIDYYFFKENFYRSLCNDLKDNCEIFYAVLDDKIISASIILFANGKMHYHFSGSDAEYRHLAPTNLLLYEAALWGYRNGFKTFHLGGGVGSTEDNLFKFKQAFNRNSGNQFSIGKRILNGKVYNELVKIRQEKEVNFDENSTFFPLYRN